MVKSGVCGVEVRTPDCGSGSGGSIPLRHPMIKPNFTMVIEDCRHCKIIRIVHFISRPDKQVLDLLEGMREESCTRCQNELNYDKLPILFHHSKLVENLKC